MKKGILSIITILLSISAIAQQYQCFQPGSKSYYVNGGHYLRGMRIDSVHSVGTSTVYYPFRTIRSNDSLGGSWLGKQVIQQQDGTAYFDNLWQDTIVIKTQANVGDQWTFYNDTTSVYYLASVAGIDTATILGQLDSVKTIMIRAMQGNTVLATDPINNYNFQLSKNHGFARIFDLYTFPYHKPGQAYDPFNADFYLKMNDYRNPLLSSFHLISFSNPTYADLYNYTAGDKFQYFGRYQDFSVDRYIWQNDSIISKVVTATDVTYSSSYNIYIDQFNPSVPNSNQRSHNGYVRSFTFPNTIDPIVDTVKMPEEVYSSFSYYYDPADTSHCYTSASYKRQAYLNPQPLEYPIQESETYKVGIGLVDTLNGGEYGGTGPGWYTIYKVDLSYSRKNGIDCGHYEPLAVSNTPFATQMSIYPNPSSTSVIINFGGTITNPAAHVEMYSINGQRVFERTCNKATLEIDVSQLPQGIYMLRTQIVGQVSNKKITVIH